MFDFALVGELGVVVVDERVQQAHTCLAGSHAEVSLAVLVDDVVDTALVRRARQTAAALRAGQRLQLERDVLQHVPHPGAFAHALDEPAQASQRAVVLVEGRHQAD
jgi:hypothetical protein